MKCARCGTGLTNDAMVCGQCGAVVGMAYGRPQDKPAFGARPPAPHAKAGSGQVVRLGPRVTALLGAPRREWPVIASEPTSARDIYLGYALPLAAIGAVALFISVVTLGTMVPLLGAVRENFVTGLAGALVVLASALAHLFILSAIVGRLARRFGGQCDALQALKVTAYSYTPIWLAGILFLFPAASILWAASVFYALYLGFWGVTIVTRCTQVQASKVILFTAIAAYLLYTFFGALTVALFGFGPAHLG